MEDLKSVDSSIITQNGTLSLKQKRNSKGSQPIPDLKAKFDSLEKRSDEEKSRSTSQDSEETEETSTADPNNSYVIPRAPKKPRPGLTAFKVFHTQKNIPLFSITEDKTTLVFAETPLEKIENALRIYQETIKINPAIKTVGNLYLPINTKKCHGLALSITLHLPSEKIQRPATIFSAILSCPKDIKIGWLAKRNLKKTVQKILQRGIDKTCGEVTFPENGTVLSMKAEGPITASPAQTPRESEDEVVTTPKPISASLRDAVIASPRTQRAILKDSFSPRVGKLRQDSPRPENSPRFDDAPIPKETTQEIREENKIYYCTFSDFMPIDFVDKKNGPNTLEELRKEYVRRKIQSLGYRSKNGAKKGASYRWLTDPENTRVVPKRFALDLKQFLEDNKPNFFARLFGTHNAKIHQILEKEYYKIIDEYASKTKPEKPTQLRIIVDGKISKRELKREEKEEAVFASQKTIRALLKKEFSLSWSERRAYFSIFNAVEKPAECDAAQFDVRRHNLALEYVDHTRLMMAR